MIWQMAFTTPRDAARALRLEAELLEIGSVLDSVGVGWISLKDPVLACRLGLAPHERG